MTRPVNKVLAATASRDKFVAALKHALILEAGACYCPSKAGDWACGSCQADSDVLELYELVRDAKPSAQAHA